MLSHENLLENCRFISRAFGICADSRGFSWLPPYHDMGLIGGILQPMYVGGYSALISPVSVIKQPLRWLEGVSRHRATLSGGPNFAYDLCVRRVGEDALARLDLSSWEVAFNGAEPIRAATLEAFAAKFGRCGFRRASFLPCYGLAEATLMVTASERRDPPVARAFDAAALEGGRAIPAEPTGSAPARLVGCGGPDVGHELAIVDPLTRRRCAPGVVGEIWVAGPSVALGYWRQPDATAETFHAGLAGEEGREFLRTGDFGVAIDGQLHVVGRLKDVLIVNGRNVHPHDVELAAEAAAPALRPHCSAAFARDDGEAARVVLAAEVDDGGEHDMAAVARAIRRRLAEALDVQLHAVLLCAPGSVPKTTSGKIQRRLCGELMAAGELEVRFVSTPDGAGRPDGAGPDGAGPDGAGPDGAG
jgi:acyl-CoA synthetase (AMP-forming)/AMP-acid ligase II